MTSEIASNQRRTYRLVENLVTGKYKNPMSLLKQLVKDIVNHDEFEITGGRVWELLPDEMAYELRMQYGSVQRIPEKYRIYIQDQPFLSDLVYERTLLKQESDTVLKSKGIDLYSVTGVGLIIKTRGGRFYQYLLGFNAPEIKQTFAETLTIISSVATIAIKNIFETKERRQIRYDLNEAAKIQKNLFPEHQKVFYDYDIYGVCVPHSEVGGDYFDYLSGSDSEEERLGIVVSDASSKGMPAAIQALFVSGAIRMGMSYSSRMSDLIVRLNKLLVKTFSNERFVSLFYCELTLSTNRLVLYVNAGHPSPIHYRPEVDRLVKLNPTGSLLGILPKQKFKVENIRMHVGDILVIYTDGVTEAMDANHIIYGENRLIEIIRRNKEASAKELVYSILDDVYRYQADAESGDDKTIVVIKRLSNIENDESCSSSIQPKL